MSLGRQRGGTTVRMSREGAEDVRGICLSRSFFMHHMCSGNYCPGAEMMVMAFTEEFT